MDYWISFLWLVIFFIQPIMVSLEESEEIVKMQSLMTFGSRIMNFDLAEPGNAITTEWELPDGWLTDRNLNYWSENLMIGVV